ncbi:hypothetical protein IOP19_004770 [Salmonella enterica]|nr:hypothetical protein [Salmonella enterica]
MGSCAAPSAKGDDKFITTDYLQQCPWAYLYLAPKSVELDNGEKVAFPYLLDQGKAELFVYPEA